MSKRPNQLTTPPAEAAPAEDAAAPHISRFQTFHGLACKSALELKLAKYFAGLEVNALCDIYAETTGITPGKRTDLQPPDSLSGGSLETFLEDRLGVSARTARRYRAHFLSITSDAPEIADKLNATWHQLTGGQESPKALPAGQELSLVTPPQGCQALSAEVMQAVCKHADEWGLHELFEPPQRDVTPPKDPDEDNESARKKAERAALVKFWSESLVKRLENEEMHRLPAPVLEAVVTKLEDAAKRARETLAAKAAKKKGGRK